MKNNFKTWAIEVAVKIWGALSFIGMFIVETEDGSCKLLPFSLPSVVSLLLCGWVFEALSKRGYFQEK